MDTKASMATFNEGAIIRVTFWELKSQLFKALGLPTSTHGIEIWGGDLKTLIKRFFFKKITKLHMMSHVKAHSSTSYHILLAKFGEGHI